MMQKTLGPDGPWVMTRLPDGHLLHHDGHPAYALQHGRNQYYCGYLQWSVVDKRYIYGNVGVVHFHGPLLIEIARMCAELTERYP